MDSNSVQSVNGLLQKLTTESHTLAFLNACDNERRSNKSATSNISVELLIEAWWREIVFELDISFCLGLPRILHYYGSPHLAFKNLLKFYFFSLFMVSTSSCFLRKLRHFVCLHLPSEGFGTPRNLIHPVVLQP